LGGKRKRNKQTEKKVSTKQAVKKQDKTSIAKKKSLTQSNECIPLDSPSANMTPKQRITPTKIAGFLTVLASIATILVLFLPTPIIPNNPPSYYTGYDWLHMDAAGAILEGTSHVQLYADSISEVGEENNTAYHDGAVLIALYSNQVEHEKIITKFRVYADDIVENISPDLKFFFQKDELEGPILCHAYNNGWGETGKIQVAFSSIRPQGGYDNDVVDICLQDGACTSWKFDSIKPGDTESMPLLREQDFVVEYREQPDENFYAYYFVVFKVEAPESNYATTIELPLIVGPDYVRLYWPGLGGGFSKNYVVWIDTSSPAYSAEYSVYQRLPGNEVMCIPMFIVPAKSCTMSVRIEFETLEGEIIQAAPLNNADFIIPYYEKPESYVDGQLLDWDSVEGNVITCLPFSTTHGDVNVSFPFVSSSMIVPSEVES